MATGFRDFLTMAWEGFQEGWNANQNAHSPPDDLRAGFFKSEQLNRRLIGGNLWLTKCPVQGGGRSD